MDDDDFEGYPESTIGPEALEHVGYNSQQVIFASGDLEQAFAFLWMERNKEEWSLLDSLLYCQGRNDEWQATTQRDARVAATVVQWLGTNVGFGFLTTALEKRGYKIVEKESLEAPR